MLKNFLVKNWQLILIVVLGLSISWPLFISGYFSHHDDLQIMRIFEMRRCFADFQIPCRWAPDMGYGNGFPLFNFYGPLPYYLGALLSYVFPFITSAKILFFAALILGGIGMYFLAKERWGSLAGATSAVLYLFAPYKALDIYVRGALSEAFALALIPFVSLFGYRLVKSGGVKTFVAFSFSLAAFLVTHNIMTIIFVPALLLWLGYHIYIKKGGLRIVLLALAFSIGLSAFFVIPAYFEKPLIQAEALTRFELDFRANFVSIKQLLWDRSWGYGGSILGPQDTISFQIGWPHWWLVIAGGLAAALRRKRKEMIIVSLMSLLFIVSVIMMHNKSTFIWERISILKYFQFPWRFLSLSIFTSSILGGYLVYVVGKSKQIILSLLIIILAVVLNWSYFKPGEFYYGLTDREKLSGALWETQQKGAILDYLPITALEPREGAPAVPEVKKGSAIITDFENHSNWWRFITDVEAQSYIEVPVFYFPGWEAKVDGEDSFINYENYLGRIGVVVGAGSHVVEGRLTDTPTRKFSNLLTVVSLAALLFMVSYGKTRKIIK